MHLTLSRFIYPFFVVSIFFVFSCSRDYAPLNTGSVIKTDFPNLGEHIIERDFEALFGFTDHSEEAVESLAWRAIAKSDATDLHSFTEYAIRMDNSGAWYALSFHSLGDELLNTITEAYREGVIVDDSVCEVFYRQGGEGQLNLLLTDKSHVMGSEICSQAIGGILARVKVPDATIQQVIDIAFGAEDEIIRRNLLYGFYRSEVNRPHLMSNNFNRMGRLWEESGVGEMDQVDQYMVRILGQRGFNILWNTVDEAHLASRVQLSVELARVLRFSQTETIDRDNILSLLKHPNPNVIAETLESLAQLTGLDEALLQFIEDNITGPTRNHELFVASLEVLLEHGIDFRNHHRKLDFAAEKNPYLTNRVLALYRELDPDDETYLIRLQDVIHKGEIRSLHGMQALTRLRQGTDDPLLMTKIRDLVRDVISGGNRSAVAASGGLLTDEILIREDDFDWINELYIQFTNGAEVENANTLAQVLEERFPDRFERRGVSSDPNFRVPDWEKLYALGLAPHWILETQRGAIEIRLFPLSSPFTVSSIDSLTGAGLYDGVAFHRIVRNFVIQGGDFDRRDGFGGPDYTLPTEPSFRSFERGAVGIASSGTDTEGGQFFIMHQWAPHLDGNYTIFGEVVRGMDVVDRIQIGDKVVRARISVR